METVNIVIEMENGDVMKGELYPEVAPITVKNFLDLIDQDFLCRINFSPRYSWIYDSRRRI